MQGRNFTQPRCLMVRGNQQDRRPSPLFQREKGWGPEEARAVKETSGELIPAVRMFPRKSGRD